MRWPECVIMAICLSSFGNQLHTYSGSSGSSSSEKGISPTITRRSSQRKTAQSFSSNMHHSKRAKCAPHPNSVSSQAPPAHTGTRYRTSPHGHAACGRTCTPLPCPLFTALAVVQLHTESIIFIASFLYFVV